MTHAGKGQGDYKIGYGKPPEHTRFRPGQSGNPAGRPRAARNLSTILEAELKKPVSVREGGNVRRVAKREALIASLVNKALQGDIRASNLLIALIQRVEAEHRPADRQAPAMDAADEAIIAAFLARTEREDGTGA
jgi:hypothetical protein